MPPSLLPPSPEELEELRARRRRASQLKGYGEGPGMGPLREAADVGRGLFGAQPITPGGEGYRTGQALANMPAVGLAAVPGKVASALPDVAAGLGALGAAGVIKPKGGNWLAGTFSVERALEPLKAPDRVRQWGGDDLTLNQAMNWPGLAPEASRNLALNKWIDTKLTKYVKNEMATPEDPVRALAERGTLHFEPQDVPNPIGWNNESRMLFSNREAANYPTEGLGKSNLARDWETLADLSVQPDKAEVFLPIKSEIERNPWLEKVSPDTPVYGMNLSTDMSKLGFNHIIDELTNALNPNSGLPASLRLTPQQLEKVTVPQAVERVAKINEWRAAQKAEADAMRARNPGTFEHKTYETVPGTAEPNQKGLRWVELKLPEIKELPPGYSVKPMSKEGRFAVYGPDGRSTGAVGRSPEEAIANQQVGRQPLEDALKYEGETMGHCVGGYCPDVIEGRSRIYSLRDKKGEPHVTIEVTPRREDTDQLLTANQLPPEIRADYERRNVLDPLMRFDPKTFLPELGQFEDEIVQIKGKGNKAPKEEYLPFVQDFVRSGNWSRVGDLKNTGLIAIDRGSDLAAAMKAENATIPQYVTQEEFTELLRKYKVGTYGYKRGGPVELKDGGRPPIESRRKASDLPGYGKGSTGALGDVVRGFMGEKPAEPTNPSELFRLAQALGAFPPVAGVVKGAKSAKSLGEMIDREVRKVRRLEELGKADLNVNIGRPAGPEVTGWHITQDTPGILKTGALTNRDVGAGNIQGYAPAHVGGAYFYSDPQLALAKREDLLEMLGQDPELAAQLPILRAQLRRGNRLLPDEDVGLNVPWQRSFEEGSFATGRPVMLNQVDRIYASDPDVMKDLIRDTAVRQRRYKGGGKVKASDLPGYGKGSAADVLPQSVIDVASGLTGGSPSEPTNPSEMFRLAQALGAFPPVAGAIGTVKRPVSALRALNELLRREAPEQAAAARQALNRALKTGEEHSVVGLTHSGGPGQVTSSGLRTQVKPNPQDLSRAINDPARSAILDFHTHPADVSGFRIAPSSDDLAFYRDYETGPRPRTVKTVIAAPPSNAGNRASTSYGFFETDNPRAVYDPETFENARLEMQLAGKRGKFDKARMDPRFKEIFESGFQDLQTLLGDAAPLLLLERRAAQGLGRQDLNLGAQRLSPEAELQTFYDLIREPAQEFMKKKKLKAGGRVKIERHPTLMADELLFKGYRK